MLELGLSAVLQDGTRHGQATRTSRSPACTAAATGTAAASGSRGTASAGSASAAADSRGGGCTTSAGTTGAGSTARGGGAAAAAAAIHWHVQPLLDRARLEGFSAWHHVSALIPEFALLPAPISKPISLQTQNYGGGTACCEMSSTGSTGHICVVSLSCMQGALLCLRGVLRDGAGGPAAALPALYATGGASREGLLCICAGQVTKSRQRLACACCCALPPSYCYCSWYHKHHSCSAITKSSTDWRKV